MSRIPSRILLGLLSLAVVVGAPAASHPSAAAHWSRIPSVTVLSSETDPRIERVAEAVSFWNQTFSQLGTPFRLGEVGHAVGAVPSDELQTLSDQVLNHSRRLTIPASLEHVPGDMIIVLSDANFVSFTATIDTGVVIAIKRDNVPPLSLPNVLVNVIAHEIGHGIGLPHNGDPTLLMCGRPAPCRPDAFQSSTPRMFPLSDQERNRLLALYPGTWTASKRRERILRRPPDRL